MRYLEDTSITCVHTVTCSTCHTEYEEEVIHYLDSESARWECSDCGAYNEQRLADCTEPDPDTDLSDP